MKTIHDPVGSPHAPETQRYGLLGAFVAGAAAVRLPVRLTADGYAAVLDDEKAATMTLKDLRALDTGEGFTTTDGKAFRYPSRVETFPMLLDFLPDELWYVVEVKPEADAKRRKKLVGEVVRAAVNRGVDDRVIVVSDEADARAEARRVSSRVCVAASEGAAGSAADLDAIVVDLETFLDDPTIGAKVRLGAIVTGATNLTPSQHSRLSELATVWGIVTNSILTTNAVARPGWVWVDEKWNQSASKFEDVNANIWHLGYAKYNPEKFCHVYPDKGLHVAIKPYDKPIQTPSTGDPVKDELQRLQERDWDAMRTWPFYSGGGAGFAPGIRGDFSAEVDIESVAAQQATTVEMAAVNVDPSTHRRPWRETADGKWVPNPPDSFRDKHTFYDPHGAPPFAGVEHDEDDGWRINWNLGTEYDSNQYGRAVGDGKALQGRMRLDRRGNYWAAWYRPDGKTGPGDWVCVGAVRNDSLNEVIYLRLAGKRWRQEDAANPKEYVPVIPNHFTFRNFTLTRYV